MPRVIVGAQYRDNPDCASSKLMVGLIRPSSLDRMLRLLHRLNAIIGPFSSWTAQKAVPDHKKSDELRDSGVHAEFAIWVT